MRFSEKNIFTNRFLYTIFFFFNSKRIAAQRYFKNMTMYTNTNTNTNTNRIFV